MGSTERLQKLQNRAARIIMNMCNDIDHSVALQALGWKPLLKTSLRAVSSPQPEFLKYQLDI